MTAFHLDHSADHPRGADPLMACHMVTVPLTYPRGVDPLLTHPQGVDPPY